MVTSQQIYTDCTHLGVAARLKCSNTSLLNQLKDAENAVLKAKDEVCKIVKDKTSEDIVTSAVMFEVESFKKNLERKRKIACLETEIQRLRCQN